MKLKRLLLPASLLLPLLAGADPLNNGALAVLAWAVLAIVAYSVLTLVLVIVAVRQPRRSGVQVFQWLCLLPLAWLTPTLGAPHRDEYALVSPGLAACLAALVPLALLLNGLTQARIAEEPRTARLWAGLAVTGAANLLWQVLGYADFHFWYVWVPGHPLWLALVWYVVPAMLVGLGSWWAVLAWLRPRAALAAALWQPGWATSAVAASLAAAYYLLYGLGSISRYELFGLDLLGLLTGCLLTAGTCWLAGVAVLRLLSPPRWQVAEMIDGTDGGKATEAGSVVE